MQTELRQFKNLINQDVLHEFVVNQKLKQCCCISPTLQNLLKISTSELEKKVQKHGHSIERLSDLCPVFSVPPDHSITIL